MGQAFSSGNNLFVHLDRPYYFPGDVVQGQVLLNCVKTFEASALVLKVEGEEKTEWNERREDRNYDGDGEWTTSTNYWSRSGQKEFFKVKVPLQSYPQHVQPGQYQFPFSFVLPLGLPGSFEYEDSSVMYSGYTLEQLKAKIKYEVKAECEVPGMLAPNIKHKATAIVHQRMDKPASQVVLQDRQSIKTCCCVGKVNNESSAEFKTVELLLKRCLKLKADGAGYYEDEDKVASVSYPGVQPGESHSGAGARRLELGLPGNIQATARGQLISCEYFLEVKLKAHSFTSNMEVKLPITIYQGPPPEYHAYTAPPPYWEPGLVAPAVQVQLPSAPPLPPMPQQMVAPPAGAYPPPAAFQGAPGTYQPPQPTYAGPN